MWSRVFFFFPLYELFYIGKIYGTLIVTISVDCFVKYRRKKNSVFLCNWNLEQIIGVEALIWFAIFKKMLVHLYLNVGNGKWEMNVLYFVCFFVVVCVHFQKLAFLLCTTEANVYWRIIYDWWLSVQYYSVSIRYSFKFSIAV